MLFSNIVADRDGIIEEITVKKGYATVKPGDVVKKGDILISAAGTIGRTVVFDGEPSYFQAARDFARVIFCGRSFSVSPLPRHTFSPSPFSARRRRSVIS